MPDAVDEFKARFRRPAIMMEIGGFRPPDNPAASWFGRVGLALPGESWPHSGDRPMIPLCQINLTDLPFWPPRLEDIEFISVFIDSADLPIGNAVNGWGWRLRAYRTIADLAPMTAPAMDPTIRAFPMRPQVHELDYPCWEDVSGDVPPELEDDYPDFIQTAPGFKLGGWPYLIQSEIYWAPMQRHPIAPEYVFQIDSNRKAGWMWGDSGIGYFGRGTATGHRDEWAMDWQCY